MTCKTGNAIEKEKMNMKNNLTRAWELYEQGRTYNNQLEPNQYSLVNTNIEFFHGNQWLHMPDTAAMRLTSRSKRPGSWRGIAPPSRMK